MTSHADALERVAALMDQTEKLANVDNEVAHGGEDDAHIAALMWIASHGDEASSRLAREAIRTVALPYPRWYA